MLAGLVRDLHTGTLAQAFRARSNNKEDVKDIVSLRSTVIDVQFSVDEACTAQAR